MTDKQATAMVNTLFIKSGIQLGQYKLDAVRVMNWFETIIMDQNPDSPNLLTERNKVSGDFRILWTPVVLSLFTERMFSGVVMHELGHMAQYLGLRPGIRTHGFQVETGNKVELDADHYAVEQGYGPQLLEAFNKILAILPSEDNQGPGVLTLKDRMTAVEIAIKTATNRKEKTHHAIA